MMLTLIKINAVVHCVVRINRQSMINPKDFAQVIYALSSELYSQYSGYEELWEMNHASCYGSLTINRLNLLKLEYLLTSLSLLAETFSIS